MTQILDSSKVSNFDVSKFDNSYKEAIEEIMLFQEYENLIFVQALEEYQNTNEENYPFILKDFLSSVNKSVGHLIKSLLLLWKNQETKELFINQIIICNQSVKIDSKKELIYNISVRDTLIEYLKIVFAHGKNAIAICKELGYTKLENSLMSYIEVDEVDYSLLFHPSHKNSKLNSKFTKREYIILTIGKEIDIVLKKHPNIPNKESLEFFSHNKHQHNKFITNPLYGIYASCNLYEEKIINKNTQYHRVFVDETNYVEAISNEAYLKFNTSSIYYTYDVTSNFEISFYIKKYLIEKYTKFDILDFISNAKDYLARYLYVAHPNKERAFNSNHPFVIESNNHIKLTSYVNLSYEKIMPKLRILQEHKENEALSIKEFWQSKLSLSEQFVNYLYHCLGENATTKDIQAILFVILKENIKKELEKRFLDEEFKKSIENVYIELIVVETSLNNVFNLLFKEDEENEENENNGIIIPEKKGLVLRNKATFHTPLKESIVFDFRGETVLKINTDKLPFKEDSELNKFEELLRNHQLHDYFEFDKDFMQKNQEFNFDTLQEMLNQSHIINLPQNLIKSKFKLRKLGNYNASGIYFSHTKALGVDFRNGKESYLHEIAHHVDLTRKISHRDKIVSMLKKELSPYIKHRRAYYLKAEELIARAGEISIVLLSGRYKQLKAKYLSKEISKESFILGIKTYFEKSNYAPLMKRWDVYFDKNLNKGIYVNIIEEIHKDKFELLDCMVAYFYSFWTGTVRKNDDSKFLDDFFQKNNDVSHDTSEYDSLFRAIRAKSDKSYSYSMSQYYLNNKDKYIEIDTILDILLKRYF